MDPRIRSLVRCTDYRSFLKNYFETPDKDYAELARKAGFSARSYPRAVVNGTRRIGPKSLLKFCNALDLPPPIRRYFTLLVYSEEPDTNFEELTPAKIARELSLIRREVERRLKSGVPTEVFHIPHGPEILASLGDPESGARVADVCKRTQLPEVVVKQGLYLLQRAGLARRLNGTNHYAAVALHLYVKPKARERFFREFYLRSVTDLPERAARDFDQENCLFLNSVYLVREADLGRLKSELRDLLLRYIDGAEECQGDRLVRLITALTPVP